MGNRVNPLVAIEKAITHVHPKFDEIAKPMGFPVRFQEEAHYAMEIMRSKPYLQRATPNSIQSSILNVAAVGLTLNPILQHGYLIPRRVGDNVICTFDPGYRGLIELATKGGDGMVKLIQAAAVYEEDYHSGNFKLTRGTQPSVIHTTDPLTKQKDMGEIIGAYCIAHVKDSPVPHVTWMPIDELLKAMEKSESANPRDPNKKPSGPWITDFQEMCVKTAIRRGRKQWPGTNLRLDTAIALANVAESYKEPEPDANAFEGEAIELINKEQAEQLRSMCKRAHMRVARVYEKFECRVMEELPLAKLKECHDLLLQAIAHYDCKNTEKGEPLYASDYGLTLGQLTDIAATYESGAALRSKRDD